MRALLPVLGVALIASIVVGLALHVHQGPKAATERHVVLFVTVLAVACLPYMIACRIVSRADAPDPIWLVLTVALAMRLLVLTQPTFLSSDLYRYIWDGRVQLAGINPYRFIPDDPALSRLRDDAIFPHVNRRDYAPTIYPPTAQLVFRALAAVSQTRIAVRLTMIAFEAIAVACLLLLLRQTGQPSSRVLIYAWNPLAVWTYAGNGHVDALAIGLIAVALLLRAARRDLLTGVALSAAILVKFLPVAIAPALWRVPRPAMPLAAVATAIGLYALYADVGTRVFGFLGAYGHEEGLSAGNGIWLLAGLNDIVPLPRRAAPVYLALAACLLAWLGLRVLRHPPDRDILAVSRDAGLLAGSTMLAVSPHYPWYFPFLGVFATLSTSTALIWMSAAPLVLYLDPFGEFFLWPSLIYLPAIILAVRDEQVRRP